MNPESFKYHSNVLEFYVKSTNEDLARFTDVAYTKIET